MWLAISDEPNDFEHISRAARHTRDRSSDDGRAMQFARAVDRADAEPVALAWLMMPVPSSNEGVRFGQFERHDVETHRASPLAWRAWLNLGTGRRATRIANTPT